MTVVHRESSLLRYTPLAGEPGRCFFGPVDLPAGERGPFLSLDPALWATFGYPAQVRMTVAAADDG